MNRHKLFMSLILVAMAYSCSNMSRTEASEKEQDALTPEEAELKALDVFRESPEDAVQLFRQAALGYEAQDNPAKSGIINLNVANIYDEYLHLPDSALVYSKKSLAIWQAIKDTMQMANIYKYIGLIEGRTGRYSSAKSNINKAINLYSLKNFQAGIAVSQINLSEVFLLEKNLSESLKYFIKSTDYWRENGELSRVFTNNIVGIKIYSELGNFAQIKDLIAENEQIKKDQNLDQFILDQFDDVKRLIEVSR